MWGNARPIEDFYKEQEGKGVKWYDANSKLTAIDYRSLDWRDYTLYRDEDGNLWESVSKVWD